MKKRILLIMTCMLFLLACMSFSSGASVLNTYTITGTITATSYTDGSIVFSGTGAIPDYTRYGSKPYMLDSPKKIVIGEGITRIGTYFVSDGNEKTILKTVELPSTLESIGNSAFWNNTALESVNLEQCVNLTEIGSQAFMYCPVKEVNLMAVTTIGKDAFSYGAMSEIILPDSTQTISENAFKDNYNLQRITIPESVTSIGAQAFYNQIRTTKTVLHSNNPLATGYDWTGSNRLLCNEYTVVFKDWDGTVIDSQKVISGDSATEPEQPSRTGYEFYGWSDDFTNITSDKVIKAQYRYETGISFESLTIKSSITKTRYNAGECIDLSGLVLEGTFHRNYDNGTYEEYKETISNNDCVFSPGTNAELSVSDTKLVISCTKNGSTKSVFIDIQVDSVEVQRKILDKIEITTPPTKTVYTEGESFDLSGAVVTATFQVIYTDGSSAYEYTDVTSECTYSTAALTTADQKVQITYRYEGVIMGQPDIYTESAMQRITVNPAQTEVTETGRTALGLTYTTTGSSEYEAGETFDISNVKIEMMYSVDFSDGTNRVVMEDVTDQCHYPTRALTTDDTEIPVSYEDENNREWECRVQITVYAGVTYYTVSFYSDGRLIDSVQVAEGNGAISPDAGTKDGYTFAGWDKDFSNVTADMSVNAIWRLNQQEQPETASKTLTGISVTCSKTAFKEGEKFTDGNEIYVVATFKVKFSDDTEGYMDEVVTDYTLGYTSALNTNVNSQLFSYTYNGKTVTKQISIKVSADENKYKVVFYNYDGSVIKSQTVEAGKDATAPANPNRDGYTFVGWDRDFSNVQENLSVTAVFKKNKTDDDTYTVTFYGKNGTVIKSQSVDRGKDATAPAAPAVTGYKFSGWSTGYSNVKKDLDVYAVYIEDEAAPAQTPAAGTTTALPTAGAAAILDSPGISTSTKENTGNKALTSSTANNSYIQPVRGEQVEAFSYTVIDRIEVTKKPRTTYAVGEYLDLSNLEIQAVYAVITNDGKKEERITLPYGTYQIENDTTLPLSIMDKEIRINVMDHGHIVTCAIPINVLEASADKLLIEIQVKDQPKVTSYKSTDVFNPYGMVVTGTYVYADTESGELKKITEEIKDYTIENAETMSENAPYIKVRYQDQELKVNLDVKDVKAKHDIKVHPAFIIAGVVTLLLLAAFIAYKKGFIRIEEESGETENE